ncbi:hypothetical protein QL285_096747 [Trifolium repens]|nr:hypothetical protein QL285_096747 [Trifolium repens]
MLPLQATPIRGTMLRGLLLLLKHISNFCPLLPRTSSLHTNLIRTSIGLCPNFIIPMLPKEPKKHRCLAFFNVRSLPA